MSMTWSGGGQVSHVRDTANRFTGRKVTGTSHISWTVTTGDFSFTAAESGQTSLTSEVWKERNGGLLLLARMGVPGRRSRFSPGMRAGSTRSVPKNLPNGCRFTHQLRFLPPDARVRPGAANLERGRKWAWHLVVNPLKSSAYAMSEMHNMICPCLTCAEGNT
jgi:hypothetical protein